MKIEKRLAQGMVHSETDLHTRVLIPLAIQFVFILLFSFLLKKLGESLMKYLLLLALLSLFPMHSQAGPHSPLLSTPDTLPMERRAFRWRIVQKLADKINNTSKLMHRSIENNDAQDENFNDLIKLSEEVHQLSASANQLYDKVQIYKRHSLGTRFEYFALKKQIKRVRVKMKPLTLSKDIIANFKTVKRLFRDVKDFY